MKHTKGEWKIKEGISYDFIKSETKLIAMIDSLDGSALIEYKANAELIAAAPELLERLEYVVSWLEDAKVHKDIVRHCKETIKKAKS